jgi:hypothetical protein
MYGLLLRKKVDVLPVTASVGNFNKLEFNKGLF